MLTATFWGFIGGLALIIGALAGVYLPVRTRAIALVMAFGGGVFERLRKPGRGG